MGHKLNFKIKEGKINLSEYFLLESYANINHNKKYIDVIKEQLQLFLNSKEKNFDHLWLQFCNFIKENEFQHFKTLALKKKTPSYKNFLEKIKEKTTIKNSNIAIILHSKKSEIINNTISLFVDYISNNSSSSTNLFHIELTRIEFFSWGLSLNLNDYIEELNIGENNCQDEDKNFNTIYEYESVFDNKDYEEDPIKFKDWSKFINHLHENIVRNNDETSNFLFMFKDDFIFASTKNINLSRSKFYINNNNSGEQLFKNDSLEEKFDGNFNWESKDYNLQNRLETLKNEYNLEINEIEKKVSETEIKINEENSNKNKKENILHDYENELNRINDDLEKVLNKIKKFNLNKNDIEKLKKENDKLIKEIDVLYKNKTIFIKDIEYLEHKLNRDLDEKDKERIKMNNELLHSKRELDSIIKKIEKNEHFIKSNKTKIDALNNEIEKINIENLNSNEKRLKENKSSKEKEINELELEIENIKNDINDYNSDLKNFKNNKTKINNYFNKVNEFNEWVIKKNLNKFQIISPKKNKEKLEDIEFPLLDDFIDNKISINSFEEYSLYDDKSGTIAVIKRFKNALENVERGYYKNPLFYLGIRKPHKTLNITYKKKLKLNILNKYSLNEKQEKALLKAINTNCFFYLQGPPGTGKTQVISAITEHVIDDNMNIIMTSSTHEAINNFFDRLNDNNKQNPNIVLLKYRYVKSKKNKEIEEKYSEVNLFKNFKDRMTNNIFECNNDDLLIKIKNYFDKFGNNTPNKFSEFLPSPIVKFVFSDFENNKKYFYKNDNKDELIDPIDYEESFTIGIKRRCENKEKDINENEKEFLKIIELIFSNIDSLKIDLDKIDFNKDYLSLIKEQINNLNQNNDNKSNLTKFIKAIKEKYSDANDNYEDEFLDYVTTNKLINVIGLTTTSKNEISIKDKKISIFSEYPIDYLIIDEISKCSMPEILSKAILSKKTIFAGDYLQLPPQSNLSDDFIINELIDSGFSFGGDKNNNEISSSELQTNGDDEQIKKSIKNNIANLFKKSFFAELVKMIKDHNIDSLPYQFLNCSHRFGKGILEIINIIYPEGEKLITPKDATSPKKYDLKLKNHNLNNDVCLINLKSPSNGFKIDHNFNLSIDDNGFDQKSDSFDFKNKKIDILYDYSYNQWSAYITMQIIEKLIDNNKEKFINKNKRIGIVTLTKQQKDVVRKYINLNDNLKNFKTYIKVDTIDNFQGREEEIIIVDFIRGSTKVVSKKVESNIGKRNISFLTEKERINVALSRAKQKLIIIGQFNYLKEITDITLFKKYFNILSDSNDSYIEIGGNDE